MAAALKCKLSLYADDSALVYSGSSPEAVAQFLSGELDTCQKWLVDNRLSLHLGKTECILFGTKRRLGAEVNFKVKLGDVVVNRVGFVKYLGVLLDQHLDFSNHVDTLIKKAASKLQFLYRNRRFLNNYTRKLLCQSLVFSSIEYCASAWYPGLLSSLCGSMDVLQRKCARFTLNLGPMSHIGTGEFKVLSWLPFSKRVSYFSLVHVFKIRNGLSPTYLSDNFTRVASVHSYNLRQSHCNFSLAHCNSPSGTFNRTATSDWNSLPRGIKEGLKQFLQRT